MPSRYAICQGVLPGCQGNYEMKVVKGTSKLTETVMLVIVVRADKSLQLCDFSPFNRTCI